MTTPTQDLTKRGAWTSASSAEADSLCAGRHIAQRGLTEPETDDAAHGNAIHAALSVQDPKGLTAEQEDIYDSCVAIEEKLLVPFFGQEIASLKAIPTREKRYWIGWADGLRHSGQIDAFYCRGTKALIVEYKTLAGDVAVSSRNMQLRDQACLFEYNYPLLTHVGVAVIQPLVTHSPEICIYTKEDIMRARAEMYHRVAASNKADAKRTAGEVQCKWCRAKINCAEYNRWAGSTAMEKNELFEVSMEEWTPAMRALFLERLPIAKKWLDFAYDEMKRLLKLDPDAIPGYTLKDGQNRSTIINPQAVFESFSKTGGTLNQFMACISVTQTKLKEAVKLTTKTKGKKLDEALEGIIGENITTKQTEPSIVRKD